MEQLTLPLSLELFPVAVTHEPIYDPYWDEISDSDNKEINFLVLEPGPILPVPEQDIYPNPDYYVLEPIKNTVPEQVTQWVEIYSPSKRNHEYYRYCWKRKGKIKHRHIPGGNIASQISIIRKKIIEKAIKNDSSPIDIEKIINNWSIK